jgi:hypothetical protein
MGKFCLKTMIERGIRMKKSSIALFVIAALFLICSFTFLPDKVGEFAIGVVSAAVLTFIGYRQQKKPASGSNVSRDQSPKPSKVEMSEEKYEFLKTKIAGVTFKDGRKSRQTVLRRLHWKDAPFDTTEAEVVLERGEYEGKPAFAVLLNGEKAGYVPAEHAQFLEDNFDRCDGVTHIETYCGTNDIYGAEITIRFRKI